MATSPKYTSYMEFAGRAPIDQKSIFKLDQSHNQNTLKSDKIDKFKLNDMHHEVRKQIKQEKEQLKSLHHEFVEVK